MTRQRDNRLAAIQPLRYTHAEAAKLLGVSESCLYKLAEDGVLEPMRNGIGARIGGRRLYYDRLELEAFARGGAPAAKAYRESKGIVTKPRRGRKARVA